MTAAREPAHWWDEHTSELELRIESPTEEGVFVEAAAAVAELLAPDGLGAPAGGEAVELSAQAGDAPALLAAWIEELVYLAESRALVPLAAEAVELGDGSVRARVRCADAEPRPLVKAVTYHRLALERCDGGWTGRVVLDV